MKQVICVTEKEFYKAEKLFKNSELFDFIPANLQENILAETIQKNNAFGVVVGIDNYVDSLYRSLTKGGVIARFGVGHDGIDKDKATENGLIVTNTPNVLTDSVAEHAIWLMGALARQIPMHDLNMKLKKWRPNSGIELKGKTLFVMGCGSIGCKVAKIASFGFGMNVIGHDIAHRDPEKMKREFGISIMADSFNEALALADFVTIHIQSIPATYHIINKDFFSKMKQNTYFINTSRGFVIDEENLYDALEQRRIAGAALDVFEIEPFKAVNPLKDVRLLDNVILTPHIGSSTVEACQGMAQCCIKNIKAAYEKNYDELDIINPQTLEKLKKGLNI